MAVPGYQDAVMLFGDSLTQAFTNGSLSQRMAEYYSRRLDVINRGFGGYNSEWGIPAFERVFPTKLQRQQGAQEVQLLTIWFGANDAVLLGNRSHVPIDKYKTNLSELISMVRSPSSKWHSPATRIVLISAPPVILADRAKFQVQRWKEFGSVGDSPSLDRALETTKQYSDACLEVAKKENVPVVDAWNAVSDIAGGCDPASLAPYFYDGLHLTSEGYSAVFNELTKVITAKWPELEPESMPMPMPHFFDIDLANPRAAISGKSHVVDEL